MTVKEMLSKLDSKELTEWRAYFRIKQERAKEAHNPPVDKKINFGLMGYRK